MTSIRPLAALWVLNVLDAWATLEEVACGIATEANPILAHMLARHGAAGMLIAKFLLLWGATGILWATDSRKVLWVAVGVYAVVAVWHAIGALLC